jgi:hypothetical protein
MWSCLSLLEFSLNMASMTVCLSTAADADQGGQCCPLSHTVSWDPPCSPALPLPQLPCGGGVLSQVEKERGKVST